MKCIKKSIFVIILILILGTTASATDDTYTIPECGIEITIPSEFTVITRDLLGDAELYEVLKEDAPEILEGFESNELLLYVLSDNYQIKMVSQEVDGLPDFNDLEEIYQDIYIESYAGIRSEDVTSKHEIYNHSQTKFLKEYYTDDINSAESLRYYTVHNGKMFGFGITPDEGSISSNDEDIFDGIIDSIRFEEEIDEETEPFRYTDDKSGLEFIVPANWKEVESSEEDDNYAAQFMSTKGKQSCIYFFRTDLMEHMTAVEKDVISRRNIKNSYFTKEEIAEVMGITPDKVFVSQKNGIEYYYGKSTVSKVESLDDYYAISTGAICIDNGWMYEFYLFGEQDSKKLEDFDQLLGSLKLPSKTSGVEVINFIILFIIILAVIFVIVLCIIKAKKRTNKNNVSDVDNGICYLESELVCLKCGQKVPSDSEFCQYCGRKITNEAEKETI